MAAKQTKPQTKRKTYLHFRRFVSGVATVCVMILFVGGLIAGTSIQEITLRACKAWLCIFAAQWALLRTFMAYEVTRGTERTRTPRGG